MNNSRIKDVLTHYQEALTNLEEATDRVVKMDREKQKKQRTKLLTKVKNAIRLALKRGKPAPPIHRSIILDVLIARDTVQKVLEDKTQDLSGKIDDLVDLVDLVDLDNRLKKQSKWIACVNLPDCRASFNPPTQSWWWFIEPRFAQWMNLLSIVCLVLSLSLIGDIVPRFLTGSPRLWENIVVILQGILVLIAGGSVFSKTAGRKLTNLFPRWFGDNSLALLSFSLAFSLLLYQSLPQIAVYYRDRGLSNYQAGRLVSAQSNYERAIAFNPNDGAAHFYLGSLYEEFHNFKGAKTEYQIAIGSGSAAAYNNLARMHILDKNYDAAAYLMRRLESNPSIKLSDNQVVHYALHKNLGWVRLEQGLQTQDKDSVKIFLAEAKANLETAIDLAREQQLSPNQQASAHCLLAKVLEAKAEDSKQELEKWEYCLDHNPVNTPEEDAWKVEAQKRLSLEKIPILPGGGS